MPGNIVKDAVLFGVHAEFVEKSLPKMKTIDPRATTGTLEALRPVAPFTNPVSAIGGACAERPEQRKSISSWAQISLALMPDVKDCECGSRTHRVSFVAMERFIFNLWP